MVRRPERPAPHQPTDWGGARNRRDDRGKPGLVVVQRRQHPGHRAGEERLSGTGRTDHHQRMAAREGKLHPTTRFELAANFGKIGAGVVDRRPETRALPLLANLGRHLNARRAATGPSSPALPNELGRLREGRSGHDLDPISETCLVRSLDGNHYPRDSPP